MRTEGQTYGRTDRYDKANGRFSQFFESTRKRTHHNTQNLQGNKKNQILNKLPTLLQMNYLSSQIDNDVILIAQIVRLQ